MPRDATCNDCRFYDSEIGGCRRFPPQWHMWPSGNQHPVFYQAVTQFPWVKETDWCGEHSPAPQEDTDAT